MRDGHTVDDIAGTKPRIRSTKTPSKERRPIDGTLRVDDIPGAQTHYTPESEKPPPRDMLGGKVVDKPGSHRFHSGRVTDPLDPVHKIHGRKVEPDPKFKPKGAPKGRQGPEFSLTTQDIDGARPGWKPTHAMGGVTEEKRRHFRNINFTGDIKGAQAGTMRRALRTTRATTDPNARNYPSLDGPGMYGHTSDEVGSTAALARAMPHTMRFRQEGAAPGSRRGGSGLSATGGVLAQTELAGPDDPMASRRLRDPRDVELDRLRATVVRERQAREQAERELMRATSSAGPRSASRPGPGNGGAGPSQESNTSEPEDAPARPGKVQGTAAAAPSPGPSSGAVSR